MGLKSSKEVVHVSCGRSHSVARAHLADEVAQLRDAGAPLFRRHAVANLIRGGVEVGEFTVQRFFALHTVILPLVFLPLLGLHLWLVQKHGNALPPSEEQKPEKERKSIPFFPNFLAKDLAMWLIAMNVIALLAALFPWQLGQPADSLKPAPVGIHPEWYFMSQFQTLKIMGRLFPGYAGEAIGLILWFLIPFYDVRGKQTSRARDVPGTVYELSYGVGLPAHAQAPASA